MPCEHSTTANEARPCFRCVDEELNHKIHQQWHTCPICLKRFRCIQSWCSQGLMFVPSKFNQCWVAHCFQSPNCWKTERYNR